MEISYIQITEAEVPELARRLRAENYPHRCTVVLLKGATADGIATPPLIRIELAANLPGVLLQLDGHEKFIDWAVRSLVDLAKQAGVPTN